MRFEHDVLVEGRSARDVYDYVSDFHRAHEWRTEVVRSSMRPEGPMRVGSELREEAVVAGRTLVTRSVIDTCEAPGGFTFAHVSGPLPVSGEYRFEDTPAGARMTYVLDIRPTGVWRLTAPLLRRNGRRTIEASMRTLADRLRPTAASPAPEARRTA